MKEDEGEAKVISYFNYSSFSAVRRRSQTGTVYKDGGEGELMWAGLPFPGFLKETGGWRWNQVTEYVNTKNCSRFK